MRGGASTGKGGGSCALGVDRRRRTASAGRGKGGFGQVAVARGVGGARARTVVGRSGGKLRRGEATRENGHARLVAEVHVVPAGSSECRA